MRRFERTAPVVGLIGVLALAATACAGLANPTTGRTITVGPNAFRHIVTLSVGDHLVVDLGQSYGVPSPDQVTLRYPQDVLALVTSDRTEVRYEFEAKRTGQGAVVVINPACQPVAGGMTGAPPPGVAPNGAPCPVLGPGGSEPSPGQAPIGPPARMFTVTVKVS
jgi:hypothetical protein